MGGRCVMRGGGGAVRCAPAAAVMLQELRRAPSRRKGVPKQDGRSRIRPAQARGPPLPRLKCLRIGV